MLAVGRGPAEQDEAGGRPAGPTLLKRRRPLPGGRAVVGGFLVALAAVGMFAAYLHATARHQTQFVVASRSLAVGHRIVPGDLSTAAMELPRTLADQETFRSPRALLGAVVVGPVRAGELVQASDVVSTPGAPGMRSLSFSIDTSRAVDGTLQVGDTVDVIATFGSGSGASTVAVARGVRIVAVANAASSLTNDGSSQVITLAVNSSDLLGLVQAINSGQVVIVRSTGASELPANQVYEGPVTQEPGGAGP